jgi:SAM-dependent methyltransferase
MGFDMPGSAYDRFMGRYSEPLAVPFVDWLDPAPGGRALDVGCGPGALTARLVDRLGADRVVAVDPSESFLTSLRERLPDVATHRATADDLPFEDDSFDEVAAQLVVHFMPEPVAGLAEMRRVARPGTRVAACTWDLAGGRAPISLLWRAARDLDPGVRGEEVRPGVARGDLTRIFLEAGLQDVDETELSVTVAHPTFEEWWEPYLATVGPIGEAVAALDPARREQLRATCRERLGDGPFELTAVAFAARGRA